LGLIRILFLSFLRVFLPRQKGTVFFYSCKDSTKLDNELLELDPTWNLRKGARHLLGRKRRRPEGSNKERFNDFSFFLELTLNHGGFITIRRDISQASKIWINEHAEGKQDFSSLSDEDWTHKKLAFEKGKEKLNQLLRLSAIAPWNYRKGSGYFLRTQSDYLDVFQLAKYTSGRHKEWKPFLAKLLGFDDSLIQKKYSLDDEESELKQSRQLSRDLTSVETTEYDRVKGTLEIKRSELTEATKGVERFNFYRRDLELNTELLEKFEKEISNHNDRRYTVGFELDKIRESIQSETIFNIDSVAQLFNEAGAAFPDSIKRSYEELLDFNKRISEERNSRLAKQRQNLLTEQKEINKALLKLNKEREEPQKRCLAPFLRPKETTKNDRHRCMTHFHVTTILTFTVTAHFWRSECRKRSLQLASLRRAGWRHSNQRSRY